MSNIQVYGEATAALSALLDSSGLTITIPAVPGETAYLQEIDLFQGQSLLNVFGELTISGLALGTMHLPISSLLLAQENITHTFVQGLPASGQDVAITFTISQMLGGGGSALLVQGAYF